VGVLMLFIGPRPTAHGSDSRRRRTQGCQDFSTIHDGYLSANRFLGRPFHSWGLGQTDGEMSETMGSNWIDRSVAFMWIGARNEPTGEF
jgi:hypothetical protein